MTSRIQTTHKQHSKQMPIDLKPTEAMAGQSWANEKSRQIDTERK